MFPLINGLFQVVKQVPMRSISGNLQRDELLVEKILEKNLTSSISSQEKIQLAITSSRLALLNPYRGTGVAIFGEVTSESALRTIRKKMLETEVGREILKKRSNLFENIIVNNHSFKDGTVGKLLQDCIPEERAPIRLIKDPELAFIMRRYRDAHDIVHALTQLPVSVAGEVALKWFESAATALPMTTLAATFGMLRCEENSEKLLADWIPWAATAGKRGAFYLTIQYENYLNYDVNDFRSQVLKWPDLPETLKDPASLSEHFKLAIIQAEREGRDPIALHKQYEKLLKNTHK